MANNLFSDDEIYVEHKKSYIPKIKPESDSALRLVQNRAFLLDNEHYDVTFLVGPNKEKFTAHKGFLSSRSEYFKAMFRGGGMAESSQNEVELSCYTSKTIRRMLEYMYLDSILDISSVTVEEFVDLLMIANEFILDDMKSYCEIGASSILCAENVGKFMVIADKYNAPLLKCACQYVCGSNITEFRENNEFRRDVSESGDLALLVIDSLPANVPKKRKRSTNDEAVSVVSGATTVPADHSPTAVISHSQSTSTNTILYHPAGPELVGNWS